MSKQTYGDNELKFIKLMMMQYTTLESENFVYPSPKLHLSPLKERKTHVRKLEIIYEEEEKENKKEFKPLQISRRTSPNELTFQSFDKVLRKVEIHPKIKVSVESSNQNQLKLEVTNDGGNIIDIVRKQLLSRRLMREGDTLSTIKFGQNLRLQLTRKTIDLPEGYHYESDVPKNNTVTRLKIWNEHGQAIWNGQVDIGKVNFRNFVKIQHHSINFNPQNQLSIPCVVTLYNFHFEQSNDQLLQKLHRYCERRGAKFLYFDILSNKLCFMIDPSSN